MVATAAAYDNGSSTVWTQCYAYLMNTSVGSEDGVPEPDLAETAEFTSDNVYTVTLKEGLTFANGNELTSEDVKHTFDRQLAINLRGAVFGAKVAAERFVEQGGGGVIINTSSTHEDWPMPSDLTYCVSKGGMRMLTHVCPGWSNVASSISTRLTQ